MVVRPSPSSTRRCACALLRARRTGFLCEGALRLRFCSVVRGWGDMLAGSWLRARRWHDVTGMSPAAPPGEDHEEDFAPSRVHRVQVQAPGSPPSSLDERLRLARASACAVHGKMPPPASLCDPFVGEFFGSLVGSAHGRVCGLNQLGFRGQVKLKRCKHFELGGDKRSKKKDTVY
jgi:hypothetical protein